MDNKLSIYEAMGGTYTEVDGMLYPGIAMGNPDCKIYEKGIAGCGKYGNLWISYMQENRELADELKEPEDNELLDFSFGE